MGKFSMEHSIGISPADFQWELKELIQKIGDPEEYNPDKRIAVEEMSGETQSLLGLFGAPQPEEPKELTYAERNRHLFKK